MSIAIPSQATADESGAYVVKDRATIVASSGIDAGEDCSIQIKSDIDTWIDSGEVLTNLQPAVNIVGPIKFRISKPVSSVAFGVEVIRDIPADLD